MILLSIAVLSISSLKTSVLTQYRALRMTCNLYRRIFSHFKRSALRDQIARLQLMLSLRTRGATPRRTRLAGFDDDDIFFTVACSISQKVQLVRSFFDKAEHLTSNSPEFAPITSMAEFWAEVTSCFPRLPWMAKMRRRTIIIGARGPCASNLPAAGSHKLLRRRTRHRWRAQVAFL